MMNRNFPAAQRVQMIFTKPVFAFDFATKLPALRRDRLHDHGWLVVLPLRLQFGPHDRREPDRGDPTRQ